MLLLLERWSKISKPKRPDAVAAAFSLWRAVFLLVAREKEQSDKKTDKKIESAARETLERVVRTNAVGFSDDLAHREWASDYYVRNAAHRIGRLLGEEDLDLYAGSPRSSVQGAWDIAYMLLRDFIAGTVSGTVDENQPPG